MHTNTLHFSQTQTHIMSFSRFYIRIILCSVISTVNALKPMCMTRTISSSFLYRRVINVRYSLYSMYSLSLSLFPFLVSFYLQTSGVTYKSSIGSLLESLLRVLNKVKKKTFSLCLLF